MDWLSDLTCCLPSASKTRVFAAKLPAASFPSRPVIPVRGRAAASHEMRYGASSRVALSRTDLDGAGDNGQVLEGTPAADLASVPKKYTSAPNSQPWLVYRGRGRDMSADEGRRMSEIMDRAVSATRLSCQQTEIANAEIDNEKARTTKKIKELSRKLRMIHTGDSPEKLKKSIENERNKLADLEHRKLSVQEQMITHKRDLTFVNSLRKEFHRGESARESRRLGGEEVRKMQYVCERRVRFGMR